MRYLKRNFFFVFILILSFQLSAMTTEAGSISGQLILDESWERKIYISLIENFNDEYTVSNNLIITSAIIDTNGFFNIQLSDIPQKWSLLRLHVVKKGVTPNSLTIGGINENFMFLIAKRDSAINIKNTNHVSVFSNVRIEGANYMQAFQYVKRLVAYPNTLDYDNAMIEKEFILDAVNEKLKMVADTSAHPLVSLYALYQTDFQGDSVKNKHFYDEYLEKWKSQDDVYFNVFRRNFYQAKPTSISSKLFWWIGVGILVIVLVFTVVLKQTRRNSFKSLSIKEREVFELLQQGMSNKEISATCNIEITTVKSHVSNIYSKLKIKSRKEARDFKIK